MIDVTILYPLYRTSDYISDFTFVPVSLDLEFQSIVDILLGAVLLEIKKTKTKKVCS